MVMNVPFQMSMFCNCCAVKCCERYGWWKCASYIRAAKVDM